ncbi:hypothetical protein [Methylomagnum sp.]
MKKALFFALALFAAAAQSSELPDLNLTPGATDSEVTAANIKESICKVTHFTWTEGHMPPVSFLENIEKEQLKQYRYTDDNLKHYQMDHLIPLSLGGHPTDPKNIWPQVLLAKWSARRKDYLEQILHDKVCKGEVSLKDAQDQIRTNWIEAYKKYIGDPDKHS